MGVLDGSRVGDGLAEAWSVPCGVWSIDWVSLASTVWYAWVTFMVAVGWLPRLGKLQNAIPVTSRMAGAKNSFRERELCCMGLSGAGLRITVTDGNRFEPPGQRSPGKQHPPPASLAHEPDISSQPYDCPFVTAARVWFAQSDTVIYMQFGQHLGIISRCITLLGMV